MQTSTNTPSRRPATRHPAASADAAADGGDGALPTNFGDISALRSTLQRRWAHENYRSRVGEALRLFDVAPAAVEEEEEGVDAKYKESANANADTEEEEEDADMRRIRTALSPETVDRFMNFGLPTDESEGRHPSEGDDAEAMGGGGGAITLLSAAVHSCLLDLREDLVGGGRGLSSSSSSSPDSEVASAAVWLEALEAAVAFDFPTCAEEVFEWFGQLAEEAECGPAVRQHILSHVLSSPSSSFAPASSSRRRRNGNTAAAPAAAAERFVDGVVLPLRRHVMAAVLSRCLSELAASRRLRRLGSFGSGSSRLSASASSFRSHPSFSSAAETPQRPSKEANQQKKERSDAVGVADRADVAAHPAAPLLFSDAKAPSVISSAPTEHTTTTPECVISAPRSDSADPIPSTSIVAAPPTTISSSFLGLDDEDDDDDAFELAVALANLDDASSAASPSSVTSPPPQAGPVEGARSEEKDEVKLGQIKGTNADDGEKEKAEGEDDADEKVSNASSTTSNPFAAAGPPTFPPPRFAATRHAAEHCTDLGEAYFIDSLVPHKGDLLAQFVRRRTADAEAQAARREEKRRRETSKRKQSGGNGGREVDEEGASAADTSSSTAAPSSPTICTRYASYHLAYFKSSDAWDDATFIRHLMPLAQRGLAHAAFDVGTCFLALRDRREGAAWLKRAAACGHTRAMVALAQIHLGASFESDVSRHRAALRAREEGSIVDALLSIFQPSSSSSSARDSIAARMGGEDGSSALPSSIAGAMESPNDKATRAAARLIGGRISDDYATDAGLPSLRGGSTAADSGGDIYYYDPAERQQLARAIMAKRSASSAFGGGASSSFHLSSILSLSSFSQEGGGRGSSSSMAKRIDYLIANTVASVPVVGTPLAGLLFGRAFATSYRRQQGKGGPRSPPPPKLDSDSRNAEEITKQINSRANVGKTSNRKFTFTSQHERRGGGMGSKTPARRRMLGGGAGEGNSDDEAEAEESQSDGGMVNGEKALRRRSQKKDAKKRVHFSGNNAGAISEDEKSDIKKKNPSSSSLGSVDVENEEEEEEVEGRRKHLITALVSGIGERRKAAGRGGGGANSFIYTILGDGSAASSLLEDQNTMIGRLFAALFLFPITLCVRTPIVLVVGPVLRLAAFVVLRVLLSTILAGASIFIAALLSPAAQRSVSTSHLWRMLQRLSSSNSDDSATSDSDDSGAESDDAEDDELLLALHRDGSYMYNTRGGNGVGGTSSALSQRIRRFVTAARRIVRRMGEGHALDDGDAIARRVGLLTVKGADGVRRDPKGLALKAEARLLRRAERRAERRRTEAAKGGNGMSSTSSGRRAEESVIAKGKATKNNSSGDAGGNAPAAPIGPRTVALLLFHTPEGVEVRTRYHLRRCLALLETTMAGCDDWDEGTKKDRSTAAALLSMLEEDAAGALRSRARASQVAQRRIAVVVGAALVLLFVLFALLLTDYITDGAIAEAVGDDGDDEDYGRYNMFGEGHGVLFDAASAAVDDDDDGPFDFGDGGLRPSSPSSKRLHQQKAHRPPQQQYHRGSTINPDSTTKKKSVGSNGKASGNPTQEGQAKQQFGEKEEGGNSKKQQKSFLASLFPKSLFFGGKRLSRRKRALLASRDEALRRQQAERDEAFVSPYSGIGRSHYAEMEVAARRSNPERNSRNDQADKDGNGGGQQRRAQQEQRARHGGEEGSAGGRRSPRHQTYQQRYTPEADADDGKAHTTHRDEGVYSYRRARPPQQPPTAGRGRGGPR